MGNNRKRHPIITSLIMAGGTFLVSILIFIASELFLRSVAFLLGMIILLSIIGIGIFFDIIGVAVAAAQESALHPKAAKKIAGAREAVYLKKNADKVASFCNDVVGDICGTLSGAVGAALIFQLIMIYPSLNKLLLGALMTGLVASLTVGGKSLAKGFAIYNSNEIVFWVGKFIKNVENFLGLNLLGWGR